ncbi:MAG: DJ-1/PfpI family protein [Thermoleophilia bacterium]
MTESTAVPQPTDASAVHVAIFPTLADWEIGHVTARIGNPAWQTTPGRLQIRTVAETLQPVRTMGGLTIVPDLTFDEFDPAASAMLILPGGDVWDTDPAITTPALDAALGCLSASVPVAAICGATAGLARIGILDDRLHTSSAPEYLVHAGGAYAGAHNYRAEPVVNDRGVITAGATHAIEFARAVLAELGVFTPEVLDAWYRLFALDDASGYGVLAAAS